MDRESARSSSLPSCGRVVTDEKMAIWRYISKRYKIDKTDGSISAKPSAFNIRRDKQGEVKESTASLFELVESNICSMGNAVRVTGLLIVTKNFKNVEDSDASGSLYVSDVDELKKDPRAFELFRTPKQKRGPLIHWDLKYADDDKEPHMLVAKSALAHICRVYICGRESLSSVALLSAPRGSTSGS